MVLRIVASSCCLLALVASAAVAQTPSLGFRYDYPANGAPRAISSADFNRDGFPDVALSGTGRDSIMVLFHNGLEDGDEAQRFRRGEEIVVGGGPFDLAVGDLNRDGWPDIAVANADLDTVTLLLGGANGVFRPKVDIPMVGNPRGIALADINRDGALDIVVTRYGAGKVTVMSGRGDGTFDPVGRTFRTTGSPQGVTVGDIDVDGWLDLIVATVSGAVNIFSMKPSGVVRAEWGLGEPVGWNVVTTGDFNNDGLLDVAAASTGGSVVGVFTNRGNLAFSYSGPIDVASSPRGIEAADLNQDGTLEILTAGRSSSAVSVLSRGADGAYAVTHTPAGSGARDVTLADFNGDGLPDVATANEYGNSTSILYNTVQLIAPGYAFDALTIPPQYDGTVYAAADFNHNGKMDLVRNDSVLLDGTTSSRRLTMAGGGVSHGGAAGDFNGDGHPDVVYASFNYLWVFWGDGSGGFLDGSGTYIGRFPAQLRAADMNRDGRLDIVAAVTPDNHSLPEAVEIWIGNGAGHFSRSYHGDVGRITWLLVNDVDRDGALDMIVSSDNGVSVMTGDGRGGQTSTVPFGTGTPRYGIALGYLNQDGALDLVVADGEHGSWGPTTTSRITVALGRGDGSFAELDTYDVGNPNDEFESNRTVLLGDLNHDGFLDVMTGNGVLLPGSPDGRLGEPQRFGVRSVRAALIADVTGDGLNDVVGFTRKSDFSEIIMRNTRRSPAQNQAPVGVDLPERGERHYVEFFEFDDQYFIPAGPVYDPDLHALRYRWTTGDGRVIGTTPFLYPNLGTGTHQVTVTIDDYRGKSVSDTMEYTIFPHKEIVMHASYPRIEGSSWQVVTDNTAAGNRRAWNPNANAPKVTSPLADPPSYIELGFIADPTQEYKLWIRLKAEGDHWTNDSVWAQFSGATDSAGNTYRIGTTSALSLHLEECSGCGISGWGWEDDAWGAVNKNGVTLRFPAGGIQRIRLQTREDGVSFDQIVLSAERYKTVRPGTAKNDRTRLPAEGIPD